MLEGEEGGEGRPVGGGERGGSGGQGLRVQGHFEGITGGRPVPIRRDVRHLGSSPPTTATAEEGAGRSFRLEEVDSSAWGAGHVRSKAGETYESSTGGSQGPTGNLSSQSGRSIRSEIVLSNLIEYKCL